MRISLPPAPGIATSLGFIAIRTAIGDREASHFSAVSEGQWTCEDSDATTRIGVTRLPCEFGPHLVSARWGVTVAVAARRTIASVELRVGFERGPLGGWSSGESLAALEFSDAATVLMIGGPDNDEIGRRISSGTLPSSWARCFPRDAVSDFGVTSWIGPHIETVLPRDSSGIGWRVPPVDEGEAFTLTAVVAMASTEPARLAVWYAVDVPYEELAALPTANRGTGESAAQ